MKLTLSTSQAADIIQKDGSFSYYGARALVEYLEQDESEGNEMELDVVALRGDYSEHSTLQEWAHDQFSNAWEELGQDETDCDDDDFDTAIRDYISERGTLLEFNGGVIVSSF